MFFCWKKTGPPQAENFDAFCHQRRRKTVFFRFGETEKSPSPMRLRVRFLSKLTECKTKNSISPPEFIFVFLNFRKKSRTLIEYFLDRSKNPSNEKTLNELWECRFLEVTSIGTWHDFVWTHRIHFISVNYQLSKLSSSSIWMQTWLQAILEFRIQYRMIIFNPVCYSYHSAINHKRAFVLNEPRHWLCEWSLCLPCRKKRKIGNRAKK